MRYNGVSRRHFLQGAAGFSLALPFMPSLMSKAHAAYFPGTKYFVTMSTEHGAVVPENYYPEADASQSELLIAGSPGNGTEHRIHHDLLQNLLSNRTSQWNPTGSPEISPVLGGFLNPYLDRINVMRGLDIMWYIAHHSGGYLGNFHANNHDSETNARLHYPPMPTIDQVIARSPRFYGADDARTLASVNLTTSVGISHGYSGQSVIQLPSTSNTSGELFRSLFGDGGGPGGQVNPDLSVVDAVLADYNRLNGSAFGPGRRLSSEDRNRLNAHIQGLRELETRLQNQGSGSCSATEPGTSRQFTNARNFATDAAEWRAFIDVMVMGFKCGATRVATMGTFHSEYGGDYHTEIAHNPLSPTGRVELVNMYRFVAEHIFTYLVSQLDEEIAPGGPTYLDNALVTWQMEHGMTAHNCVSMPTLTAGSAGGYFNTGMFADFRNRTNRGYELFDETNPGIPMNRWLKAVLDSMGVEPAEYKVGALANMRGYGDSFSDTPNFFGHVCYPSNLIAMNDDPMPLIIAP